MRSYKKPGDVVTYTALAAGKDDDVVVIGARIAVLTSDVAAGDKVEARVRGVHLLPKKSGDTFAQGALVYWDNTNKYFTSTSAGNTLGGYAETAAVSADTTMRVSINA